LGKLRASYLPRVVTGTIETENLRSADKISSGTCVGLNRNTGLKPFLDAKPEIITSLRFGCGLEIFSKIV